MTKSAHLYHYVVLVLGLLASFFLFLHFTQKPAYQMVSAFAGCAFYTSWGIIHALLEQRLNKHVAFEYLSLALFVFALLAISTALI